MQGYMEDKLSGLHATGSAAKFKEKLFAFVVGLTVTFILPYLHIGVFYYIWEPNKPTVDRKHCKCDCFDTVFRGKYEWPPSSYKHVYFNATSNTLKIWFVVVAGAIALHEAVKYLVLIATSGKIRHSMLAVLFTSIYPHYYGWWGLINYLNEDFYFQWNHQIYFTLTEIVSTVMVLHLCNMDNRVMPWKLLLIISINLNHMIVGGLDLLLMRFSDHAGFENVRNVGLILPDLFHVLVPFFEVQILAERRGVSMYSLFYKEELMLSSLFIIMCSIIARNL